MEKLPTFVQARTEDKMSSTLNRPIFLLNGKVMITPFQYVFTAMCLTTRHQREIFVQKQKTGENFDF